MRKDWFTETVTVYNRYRNPDTGKDDWKRTVVEGALWLTDNTRHITGQNKMINLSNDFVMLLENPLYIDPEQYQISPSGFTLATGDLIVYGACEDEVSEGKPLSRIKESNKSFDIQGAEVFNKPFMRCKHYEIMGV